MRIATIDVGTNTLLLLVADVEGDEIRVVDDRCRLERLGKGVDKTGRLDPDAIARGLDALREYAGAIRAAGATKVVAVGTQALREAKNGDEFLGPAREILGVDVEVIGGHREAELAFAAVMHSFPELRRGPVLVVDVGGGSTEYIVGRDGAIVSATSVPIGSVRLAERFLHGDPPAPDEARRLVEHVDGELAKLSLPRGAPVVGTAGTATTLASVALGVWPYDGSRIQGFALPRVEIERQLARYLELPAAERATRMRGLDPKRADVIPAGAAILARSLAAAGADTLIVSDRGIRFGLLAAYQSSPPERP
jgi:exopolyphosphatase/guanosine-5'-triphosphate,3'-diphosphate pyrophosphatase